MTDIHEIIAKALERNPSDLHISAGVAPVCRVDGRLLPLDIPAPSADDTLAYAKELLSPEQFVQLELNGELDVALASDESRTVRMRLNAFRQRGSYSLAFRILNQKIPPFDELGLSPEICEGFCRLQHGLVLVTGATGTGKTTTITAMIDWINKNRSCHIITLEDPIEYYHRHNRSIVHQREIGPDTRSFASALRAALRQDPDVIFVGEMRDLDSISTAITAAETGHLVFSTLHTIGSAKTIDRIIDVFPTGQQQQIRIQLSMVLQGIISQQLIPELSGSGRALATEVLMMTPAIRNLIRENRTAQIPNAITTGAQLGMRTMETSLVELVSQGRISADEARIYAAVPENLDTLLERMGRK